MSLDHSANAIPAIQREQHGHVGDNELQPGFIRTQDTEYDQKIVESGSYTYICIAPPGSTVSAEVWQCKRIDESVAGTTIIRFANGSSSFTNSATDPTAHTY